MLFINGVQFVVPVFYLDPGSGSFIVQLLLGAGLGVAVAVKMYFAKIKNLVTRKKADDSAHVDTENQEH